VSYKYQPNFIEANVPAAGPDADKLAHPHQEVKL
jgi:hypothetical protein